MCQPPCWKPPDVSSSGAPGACTTPSRLIHSNTITFRISHSFWSPARSILWTGVLGRNRNGFLGSIRLVRRDDDPCAGGHRAHHSQGSLGAPLPEQTLAASQEDGVDHEPVLVHQVVLHQRLDEITAPEDDDVLP